jgi:hypothetical protein
MINGQLSKVFSNGVRNGSLLGDLFVESSGEHFFIVDKAVTHKDLLHSSTLLGWLYRRDLSAYWLDK